MPSPFSSGGLSPLSDHVDGEDVQCDKSRIEYFSNVHGNNNNRYSV